MSDKVKFPTRRSLCKTILGARIQIGKGFDLTHGYKYQVYAVKGFKISWAFHSNKFTAVRNAIKLLEK